MSFWFGAASALGWLIVVVSARVFRGRFYATFGAIVLGIHTLLAIAQAPAFARVWPLYAALQAVTCVHFLMLVRPAMRPRWYRTLVSVPASWFVAGTFPAGEPTNFSVTWEGVWISPVFWSLPPPSAGWPSSWQAWLRWGPTSPIAASSC